MTVQTQTSPLEPTNDQVSALESGRAPPPARRALAEYARAYWDRYTGGAGA